MKYILVSLALLACGCSRQSNTIAVICYNDTFDSQVVNFKTHNQLNIVHDNNGKVYLAAEDYPTVDISGKQCGAVGYSE